MTAETTHAAPFGEIISDGATVTCHLCGRSLKSVTAHLRAHGCTKTAYCETFGPERGQNCPGMRPGPAPAARANRERAVRHRAGVDPAEAVAVRQDLPGRDGSRWRQAVTALGFADVRGYLRDRHLVHHQTVSAIGAEIGMSNHAVAAALTRHGPTRTAHAGKRHAARERLAQVAAVLGVDSVPQYVAERRAAGWTWPAIAAECGQPESWLRRQSPGRVSVAADGAR